MATESSILSAFLFDFAFRSSLYPYQIINLFGQEVVAIEASLERQEYFGGRGDFLR